MPPPSSTISSVVRDNHNRGTVGDFLRAELRANANLDIIAACFIVLVSNNLKTPLDYLGKFRLLFSKAVPGHQHNGHTFADEIGQTLSKSATPRTTPIR